MYMYNKCYWVTNTPWPSLSLIDLLYCVYVYIINFLKQVTAEAIDVYFRQLNLKS